MGLAIVWIQMDWVGSEKVVLVHGAKHSEHPIPRMSLVF
jgi:hypothetical protein